MLLNSEIVTSSMDSRGIQGVLTQVWRYDNQLREPSNTL